MDEINLYIDESGNLGPGMGRYFLICAIEVNSNVSKGMARRAGRIINRFKAKYGLPKKKEIKGSLLKTDQRLELINSILFREIKIRYIVLDIKNTTMLLEKADDKNACYNYLIQLIVKQLLVDYPTLTKVNLYLDNRSVKIGNRLSLKPYLYNKMVLEKLESGEEVHRIEFVTNYMESESCYLIQWADILSNSLYKKYNSNIDTFYQIIKSYIIFESKFPTKNFGKTKKKELTQTL
ncbi:MAG: DUF3800 domain-containing protein [Bacilli bacterium]|nr:DUF3800 domain-containing protein [Bacilli bacterium]